MRRVREGGALEKGSGEANARKGGGIT